MADTRLSKITVRKGNFSDLPLLDAGEIGYATDVRRLFIGNSAVSIGTGDGTKTSGFILPIEANKPTIITISVAGVVVNAATYTLSGNDINFATAPANGAAVTANFNNEIEIDSNVTLPSSVELAANGSSAQTGFVTNSALYNIVVMDYTLESTNGVRIGQLRFGKDISASTGTISDNYTETAAVGITFSIDIAGSAMILKYTDADNLIAKFKYTYQLWNSN